jgi:hypothetical protein
MLIKPVELTENDIYMQVHYHARFTGKHYHEPCFFEMMRNKYHLVNPDEL